ncbi:MAG: alkene reductase [Planctomycetota bacterium]
MSALFDPLELPGLTLPNRVVMAPMTRGRAGREGVPNAMMADYYAMRADTGLILSEATGISDEGLGWPNAPGIFNDAQVEGWKPVVERVHAAGGRMFQQLWHMGRASHSSMMPGGAPPVAPSAVPIEDDGVYTYDGKQPRETPRALATDELPRIVDDYRNAAERSQAAGFDGVEIHSANGYLLDEFLQSKTNCRDDAYGGSIENRYRLLGEVVAAVADVWGSSKVGVRLSPNGTYNDMGSPDYREQFGFVLGELAKLGLAYVHVMDGLFSGFHDYGEPFTLDVVREHYAGTLIGNCGYDLTQAEAAVSGPADLIAFGRPFLANPDLVARFENGWPLAEEAPVAVWYSSGPEGYVDWPTYSGRG